jgi:curved DNA-binding protein CbpA
MRVPSILPILFGLDIVAIRFSDTFAFLPTHHHQYFLTHEAHHQHQHSNSHKSQQFQHHDRLQSQLSAKTKSKATFVSRDVDEDDDFDDDDNFDFDFDDDTPDLGAVTLTVKADLKITLYDVLGASPTHSRPELKKCYITMAKKYHPDAMISNSNSNSNAIDNDNDNNDTNTDNPDFSDIAAAWRVLSDPKERKRYDRTLQAEQFSQDVTNMFASTWGKQAGPAAKIFESVAIPFIRRTTATTLASIQAAAQDLNQKQDFVVDVDFDNVDYNNDNADNGMDNTEGSEYNNQRDSNNSNSTTGTGSTNTITSNGTKGNSTSASAAITATNTQRRQQQQQQQQQQPTKQQRVKPDFSRAFRSAVAAAQRAGRFVDSMELTEKSDSLIARAQKGAQEAAQLQQELQKLATKRLQMVLHTPGSGLTSADAALVLEDFNNTVSDVDQLSMWDQVLMKQTATKEIQELQKYELGFVETQAVETRDQLEYQKNVLARLKAKSSLVSAEKKEQDLRQALEEAQKHVSESKQALDLVLRNFTVAEQVCRKSQLEKKRATRLMERQSEKVRAALRDKEREVLKLKGLTETDTVSDSVSDSETEARLQELLEIRREEKRLIERSARVEGVAARLLSRANKLKISADEMHNMQ